MVKINNLNEYGINIYTNPKEMVRLFNQLNLERINSNCMYNRIKTYESTNKNIVNAETGFVYENKIIGSNDEKKFFKVSRFEIQEGEKRYNSKILFYNSPDEFEDHLKINLSKEIKDLWINKNKKN